ncbi:MAG: 3-hydroxyacyl-CoA dehydrogenase family protein [SAR92 clade bacterium]|nr:3-hydroxyacyl-CoA dehydrogenase family protein [SAR92 clade bacterium]
MIDNNKIAIIGAGLMGAGIAQVFASKGFSVSVCDPIEDVRLSLKTRIQDGLKSVASDPSIADHVNVTRDMSEALSGAFAVFEAAPEKLEIKQSIFKELDKIAAPETILASNTSVISISNIAKSVIRRERMLGTHWWNPPYLVPLVEVVPIAETKDKVTTQMIDLLSNVGKKPVLVKRDVPGFVGNRLQHALWREAHALIEEGVCDAETIDIVVKNSFGMRLPVLGPIENADLVGLDLTLDIHRTILPELSKRSDPSPALVKNIEAGRLGFKTGKGFRDWTDEQIQETRTTLSQHLLKTLRE